MHPSAAVGAVPPAQDGAAPRAATADSRLALFGHDLRAAMSDIVGGLRLIDLDAVEPATRLQLERVRAASENLARLMEDALTVMTGEEGSGGTADSLPLGRLLHDVEMRWSGRAREKGLSFDITRTADLPRVIRLDRLALERILSNLLSNAIKYTDVGRITLHVGRTPSGGLSFRVLDDGPGFPSLAQEAP
ncbi:MAG: HAMP domain-containing histidine kinase, partial [Paracoccaceae bacterium]|nr:HAMP domain-containing histidine kinase [Paracoccaceae bacterium]